MALEKATQRFLQMAAASSVDVCSDDINDIRARGKEIQALWDVPQVDVLRETDHFIGGPHGDIPLRIYWPVQSRDNKRLPVLTAYHGGGWVFGGLDLYDNLCRYLCRYGRVIVVSVDYRLAPEHKFPAAIEDSFAALTWVAENAESLGGDVGKVCVGGDSAGGNIAAVLCHMARQRGGPQIWKQLLFYPSVDIAHGEQYPSRQRYGGDAYGLPDQAIREYLHLYAKSEADYRDMRLCPMLANDFSDLPAALIIMPECDPLRDEGEQYAERLKAAGVAVEYKLYPGVVHGFICQAGIVGLGLEALNDAAAFLRGESA